MLDFTHSLADLSGAFILRHFRKRIAVDDKKSHGVFDPVTVADRGAERIIRRELRRSFPDHGIIGEELGEHRPDARFRWILDPIDGTRAFIMGSPMWGTLIGLMDREAPYLGMLDQPYTGERFWSGERAAFMRDARGKVSRMKTRPCGTLDEATVATTHPDLFAVGRERQSFERMKREARMTRFGGDCYNYALLAAGFVDVVIESGLKGYDIAALVPIVERAGGRVTTWDGGSPMRGGRILATGDPGLHEQLIAFLARRT